MEKLEKALSCMMIIALTICAVNLLIKTNKLTKERHLRNDEMKKINEKLQSLYHDVHEGIKSGELNVVIMTKDNGIHSFSKTTKKNGRSNSRKR